MRKQSRSHSSSGRRVRTAARRHFRPRVEALEDRRLLAAGLFVENFSDDLDLALPGFDQFDNFPSRDINPNDPNDTTFDDPTTLNTVAPDELQILNDLPRYGPTTPADIDGQTIYLRHTVHDGPTAGGGFYAVREWQPASNPQETLPNGHYLFVRTNHVFGSLLSFSFPTPGSPGGFAADEEVSLIAFSFQGFGSFQIEGINGVLDVPFGSSSWQRVTIGQDHVLSNGLELGAILGLRFDTGPDGGFVSIDDVTVLVGGAVPNQPPDARDDVIVIDRNTGATPYFNPRDNDLDEEGLAIVSYGLPAHGALHEVGADFVYEPSAAFLADPDLSSDSFTYTVRDAHGLTDSATATIYKPFGRDDTYHVAHGATGAVHVAAAIGVLANDGGPPGSTLSIGLAQPPQFGDVVLQSSGEFSYVSSQPGNLVVSDSFTYALDYGDFPLEYVSAFIRVPNVRPIAGDGQFFLAHGTPGPLGDILAVQDGDKDPIRSITLVSAPLHGQLTAFGLVNGVPQFEYMPDTGDFRGYDNFTFRVHDGYNSSNTAQIEFIVPNTPPIADDFDFSPAIFDPRQRDSYSILGPSGSTAVTGSLLRHPLDLDRDPLQVTVGEFIDEFGNRFGAPQHGTVTADPDGSFTYTPHPGYNVFGSDRFAYRLSDGYESSEIAWVTVRQALGQGTPRSNSFSVLRGERLLVHTATLLANDSFDTGLTASPFAYQLRITENGDSSGQTHLYRGDNDAPVHRGDVVPAGIGLYFDAPNRPSFWHLEYEFRFLNPLDATLVTNLVASDRAQLLIEVTEVPDFDGDGVGDQSEAFLTRDGATQGDGNNDGIEDYFQPNVATFSTALVGGDVVTIEVGGGLSLFDVHPIVNPSPADQPPNAQFPLGFLSFQITGLLPSGQAQVTIWLPPGMMLNGYYKHSVPGWHTVAGSSPPLYVSGNDGWYDFGFDGRTGAVITPSSIVLYLEDNARGDSDHMADGVISDPGGPALITSAPHVTSIVINDGSAQRSKINSLTVTFDGLVTIDPGAFELRRMGMNRPIDLTVALSEIDGRTVALLKFKGTGVQHGSLKDGNYTLTIRGDKVRDASGNLLDGDGDGLAGGNYVDEFFRLFGDTDGDGDVDNADKAVFNSAFGKRSRDPGYLWYLDFNANGRIWAEDAALFLLGYCRSNQRR